MTRLMVLMMAILLLTGAATDTQVNDRTNMKVFLQNSVYEGMKTDSFSTALANSILESRDNWVAKCPICDNVKRGIRKYVANGNVSFEPKNDRVIAFQGAESGDIQTRKALKAMVDYYVEQHYQTLEMTDDEREAMERQMKNGRKKGMMRASGGESFFCPSCDGACGIK